jgi:hypothetical protein
MYPIYASLVDGPPPPCVCPALRPPPPPGTFTGVGQPLTQGRRRLARRGTTAVAGTTAVGAVGVAGDQAAHLAGRVQQGLGLGLGLALGSGSGSGSGLGSGSGSELGLGLTWSVVCSSCDR